MGILMYFLINSEVFKSFRANIDSLKSKVKQNIFLGLRAGRCEIFPGEIGEHRFPWLEVKEDDIHNRQTPFFTLNPGEINS
jgi:hypothetical protein